MKTYQSQTLNRVAEGLYRTGEGTYFARLRINGKGYKKSLGTHDRKLADRKLKDFVTKVQAEEHLKPDLTFGEVAERWLASLYHMKPRSKKRRELSVNLFQPLFGHQLMRDITRQEVVEWAASRSQDPGRKNKKLSARTFNADRQALHMIFAYAKDTLEIVSHNFVSVAVKRAKAVKTVVIPPTKEQFSLIMEYADKSPSVHGANFIKFLAYSGCRADEARNVLWQHADFQNGHVLISGGMDGTKNMKQRYLPMFAPLRALLEEMAKKEHKLTDRLFPIRTAIGLLKFASESIGLPKQQHFVHHSMRHFFCSNCIEAGIDFATIAGWLGHSDGGKLVAGTYGHLRAAHGAEMAKLVNFSV